MQTMDTELTCNDGLPRAENPKRVVAGIRNRALRSGLTPEGREKLRQTAEAFQPWTHSNGPRTVEGKAKAAENGRTRQKGPFSVRQIRAEQAVFRLWDRELSEYLSTTLPD